MQVCVVSDRDPLSSRIRRALEGAGQPCPASNILGVAEAERYLLRQRPELVVLAAGEDPEATVPAVLRFRDLAPGHLLAVGPLVEPKAVLKVLRSGATDYVDEAEVEVELPAALARLATNRAERGAPGRIVAVLGATGGAGASLVAANLAVALAKLHERAMLVDLDAATGDLAAMLNLRPTHTLRDLIRNASRIDKTLLEQVLEKHHSGVHLLASPREFGPLAAEAPEALAHALDLSRALFPRVVIDAEATSAATLKLADAVLIVLRLEFNALRNTRALLEHLDRAGVAQDRVLLVGNRRGQPREIAVAKAEEALGRKFFALLPDDPKAALGSQNGGIPAVVEYRSSRLAKSLQKLAEALEARPATTQKGGDR